MAILKNVNVYYVKCNPRRPNPKYNRANPTWEVQLRTTDKSVKSEWEKMGLLPKPVLPDDGDPYWRLNLRKKSIKNDKTPSSPVVVVDAKMNPLDPETIGNGSVANVRIFQYEYKKADGTQGIAAVLMGLQILKYVKYESRKQDDFCEEEQETEVVDAQSGGSDDEDFAEVGSTPEPRNTAVGDDADY